MHGAGQTRRQRLSPAANRGDPGGTWREDSASGGPPCQSYSVIGRSRNAGNHKYDADEDDRQSLYEQYVEVLARLRPVVAVMENVKGMPSARKNGKLIFLEIMHSLRQAGGTNGYKLFALNARTSACSWGEGLEPKDFLVHAEDHGVPQSRHRVFVICVRSDLAAMLPDACLPRLEPERGTVSVKDVIGAMPRLRSRLSAIRGCPQGAATDVPPAPRPSTLPFWPTPRSSGRWRWHGACRSLPWPTPALVPEVSRR